MSWFKRKNNPDVVDLVDLQKRGITPEPVPEANKEGVVDLSSDASNFQNTSNTGDLGFLSNLAVAGSGDASGDSPGPLTSSLRTARQKNQVTNQINELKLKMDDNGYKIGQLNERIKELESRLREFESK